MASPSRAALSLLALAAAGGLASPGRARPAWPRPEPPPPDHAAPAPPAQAAGPGPAAHRPRFGMNLAQVADWGREWSLVDVFKPSRAWMERGPGPFAYDARGDPLLK